MLPSTTNGARMPENLTLADAEAKLRADGRFAWLLSGRQAWSVKDAAEQYSAATGIPISHDTMTRWFKRLPPGEWENYPGTIGLRASRAGLIAFFASGEHLRRTE